MLAETFGVSQTPIRDALRAFEQEALVTVHPQSSTMVAPIDLAHAHEAQFLRISLKCEVSRTIALDPAGHDLATPERLLEDMHRAWDGQDKPTFVRSDLDYHRAMFRTAGHEGLWEIVKRLSGNVDRLLTFDLPEPGKAAQILAAHHAHLDALGLRTGPAAKPRRRTPALIAETA